VPSVTDNVNTDAIVISD